MKRIVAALIACAVLALAYPAFGCTGFAAYGEQPVYGMNFDYPGTELRLTVSENRCQKHFAMAFLTEDYYQPTVGMNDRGLFASMQMQFPAQVGQDQHTVDELFVHELFGCIRSFGSVAGVQDFVGDRRLKQYSGVTLHVLLADAEGNAMIAEAGAEQNEFLRIDGDFIVMTNFKNSDFRDTPYDQVDGAGADRYITAYEYIGENIEAFGMEQAFETLKLTAQEGSYPTLCSMVFMPEEHSVYVALHRDFDRIWKVSILDGTIETWRGFEQDMRFYIPEDGVMASDLIDGDMASYETYTEPDASEAAPPDTDAETAADTGTAGTDSTGSLNGYWAAGIVLALAVVLVIGILVRNRRRAS